MSKLQVKSPRKSRPPLSSNNPLTVAHENDKNSLPFPEWNDNEINEEKWDEFSTKGKFDEQSKTFFEDVQKVHLPPSLIEDKWKRCMDIIPNANFVIYTQTTIYPDLIAPNHHLIHSEFYRCFISSVETLLYIGCTRSFPEEYATAVFNAQSANRMWRPWYHIYSKCKIGKGRSEHNPLFNPAGKMFCNLPAGKYIVRLFWMGTWRKIYVDDFLPVDQSGNILLPTLHVPKPVLSVVEEERVDQPPPPQPQTGKSKSAKNETTKSSTKKSKSAAPGTRRGGGGDSTTKKDIVEMWPFILCKALLKLSSLSCSREKKELNHFDIIYCLTGWIPQKVSVQDMSSMEIWDILLSYVDLYQWETDTEIKKKPKEIEKGNKKGPDTSRSAKIPDGDRFIVISCESFENSQEVVEEEEPGKLQSIEGNQRYFISQVRNIPLVKPPPRPVLEFWKTFRYEQWAVARGIIPPDIATLNIKSLKIVNPFHRCKRIADEPFQIVADNNNGVIINDGWKENRTLLTVSIKNLHFPATDERRSEKDDKSLSKKSFGTTKSKGAGGNQMELKPDPSDWIDFNELATLIKGINVYFQPRIFKQKVKISNINFAYKSIDFEHIDFDIARNEPIYLFSDTIAKKLLILNLNQMGNVNMLRKSEIDSSVEEQKAQHDNSGDFCIDLVLAKTKRPDEPKTETEQPRKHPDCTTKSIHFLLEEFDWQSSQCGESKGLLQTIGSNSLMLDFEPGRKSFKLWIMATRSYVLQLFSDTSWTIGGLEDYYRACVNESQLLINLCYELSTAFGKLIQAFGLPAHSTQLKQFYNCYKPKLDESLSKKQLNTIHMAFLEEFFKIAPSIPSNIIKSPLTPIQCVRLLFVQLKSYDRINPFDPKSLPHLIPEDFPEMNQVVYAKQMQRSAVKLQAFFKGLYVRLQLRKLKTTHKDYKSIMQSLKTLYIDAFTSEKCLNRLTIMFRQFLERQDMIDLRNRFVYYKDIQSVLNILQFPNTNKFNVDEQNQRWVLLGRQEFHVNSPKPILIRITLFAEMTARYYLKVFNNDNNSSQEMKRLGCSDSIDLYESNVNGYTILGYGWLDNAVNRTQRINSKLIIATKRTSRNNVILIPDEIVKETRFKGAYLPNCNNIVCRFKIDLSSNAILTAALETTSPNAKLSFILTSDDGTIIQQRYGVTNVLLSHVVFPNIDTSDCRNWKGGKTILSDLLLSQPRLSDRLSEITYSKLDKIRKQSIDRSGSVAGDTITTRENIKRLTQRKDRSKSSVSRESEWRSISDKTGSNEVHRNSLRAISLRSLPPTEPQSIALSAAEDKQNNTSIASSSQQQQQENESSLLMAYNSHREYILEAKVLENSWPLTAAEWKQVQCLNEANYLNLLDEDEGNKRERKLSISVNGKLLELQQPPPYWILNLAYGQNDLIEFELDNSQCEWRRQMKLKWFERDKDRYRKAMELRNAYLMEHLKEKPAAEYNENEDDDNIVARNEKIETENKRSNNPEDFAEKIIEEFPIDAFLLKPFDQIDADNCKVKKSEDYEKEDTNLEQTIEKYKEDKELIDLQHENILNEQIKNHEDISQWFKRIREDSAEMIDEAIKMQKTMTEIIAKKQKGDEKKDVVGKKKGNEGKKEKKSKK